MFSSPWINLPSNINYVGAQVEIKGTPSSLHTQISLGAFLHVLVKLFCLILQPARQEKRRKRRSLASLGSANTVEPQYVCSNAEKTKGVIRRKPKTKKLSPFPSGLLSSFLLIALHIVQRITLGPMFREREKKKSSKPSKNQNNNNKSKMEIEKHFY